MKKAVLTALLAITFLRVQSQNLVPNGSFEDTIWCGNDSTVLQPHNWYSPNSGTPDYFRDSLMASNGCSSSTYFSSFGGGSYLNGFGYQLPHLGLAYAGIRTHDEYLGIKLNDSLKSGKKYCLETYVSLANSSQYGLDLIQFSFSNSPLTNYDTIAGNFIPLDSVHVNVETMAGNFLLDTMNWMLVSDTFIAVGGEKYLTIGNFDSNDTQNQYQSTNPSGIVFCYYYFDDLAVYYCDLPDDTNPQEVPPDISLSPNPSNGEIFLKGNFPEKTSIEIFNMLGQIVFVSDVPEGNHSTQLFLSLAQGIYTYRIKSDDILKSGKMIIVK
jgi:hypothetical protein